MGMRRSFNCGWCASKRTQRVVDSRAAVGDAPEADLPDNRSLFPVWTHSGRPQWCVLMQYAYPTCKMRYLANGTTFDDAGTVYNYFYFPFTKQKYVELVSPVLLLSNMSHGQIKYSYLDRETRTPIRNHGRGILLFFLFFFPFSFFLSFFPSLCAFTHPIFSEGDAVKSGANQAKKFAPGHKDRL